MREHHKRIRISLFAFIEILLAFTACILVMGLDAGYADFQKIGMATYPQLDLLITLNTVTLVVFLVTAAGIMGIQLINMHRRKSEIALHKAIGADNKDILLFILRDTFLLILVPAMIGSIIGIILTAVLPFHKIGLKTSINPTVLLCCIISLLLFTGLSGLLPAIKAIHMNPVEILRHQGEKMNHQKIGKRGFLYYAFMSAIIVSGVIINQRIEAEHQKDINNTMGVPPKVSQTAPAFSFKNAEGGIISSDILSGRKFCLIIWDKTNSVSDAVFGDLNRLIGDGKIRSEDIIAVNIDKPIDQVKAYFMKTDTIIVPFIDDQKSTKWAYHAAYLPALYLVDEEGMITARAIGWSGSTEVNFMNSISNNGEE